MNQKMKKLLVTAMAFVMLTCLSLPAMADDIGSAGEMPDPDRGGSITVHKYASDVEPEEYGNGLEITDQNKLKEFGTPLKDVGFTLYMVKDTYNLTKDTTPEQAKANADIVGTEDFTDENGVLVFDNLDSARYYVLEETTPPVDGEYRAMEMVIISVPYGYSGTQEGWNYDVHVYPKNVNIEEVTKEVEDEQTKYLVGDTVTWKISGRVNSELRAGDPGSYSYGYLRFIDVLDERLDFTADSETLAGVLKDGTTVSLIKTTDYTAVYESSSNTVTFTITDQGIDKLLDNKAGRVDIEFDTVINSKAVSGVPGSSTEDNTVIENDVTKEWSNHDESVEKDATPDEKPEIQLGYIDFLKVDSEFKDIKLDGAQFKIATSLQNAQNKTFIKDSSGKDLVITTGKDNRPGGEEHGYGIFIGLQTSLETDKEYYIVEVKAPNAPASNPEWKYVLRPDAIQVILRAAEDHTSITIENTRVGKDGPGPVFKLPMTGGTGAIIIVAAGILLVLGGMIALKKTEKKK